MRLRKDKKMTNRRAAGQGYESREQPLVSGGTQITIFMVYEEKESIEKEMLKVQEKEGPTPGEITQERSGRNPDQPGKTTFCQ